jgi:hypothetical protein
VPGSHPGDLFACRWAPDDDVEAEAFRVVEIEDVGPDALTVWCYSEEFSEPPAQVDPRRLTRIGLHERVGGAIRVRHAEFGSWRPVHVART